MRQILFFAIAALVLAGVMPRVMGSVGNRPASEAQQPVKKTEPPPPQQTANYRTVTVRGDSRGHFQVEGSVDGRRIDLMVDTGASLVALRERDASKLGFFPAARDYTMRTSTANGIIKVAPVRLPRSKSTESASTTCRRSSFRINRSARTCSACRFSRACAASRWPMAVS